MKQREDIETILQNEPLIHASASLDGLFFPWDESRGGSIYYGTGLTTPKAPSIGLPFDVLILVLVAERMRTLLGLTEIHHHIADTHALTNSFCTKEQVDAMAQEYRVLLERIAKVTGIPLTVRLSSEFDSTEAYTETLARIETDKGDYVRRELADMLWYKSNQNVVLKLGWLMQAGEAELGFDERLYDQEFRLRCDASMSFAYTLAGRTLDRQRSRVSPYISIEGETRLLFKPDESVSAKFETGINNWNGDKTAGGALRHLSNIMRLWDKTSQTEIPRDKNILNRVQAVIDLVCKP